VPSLASAWQFMSANPIVTLVLLLPGSVVGGLYALRRVLA
jgi:hypothetical protein